MIRLQNKPCSVEGCNSLVLAKDLCPKHYRHDRWEKRKSIEQAQHREWINKNPGKSRSYWRSYNIRHGVRKVIMDRSSELRRKYGITLDEFNRMKVEQKGRCAICLKRCHSLHVDHCHKVKNVRALLCGNCNRGIGVMQESPEILRAAARYLENQCQEFSLLEVSERLAEYYIEN